MMTRAFQPWFERYPERFQAEKAILEEAKFVLNAEALASGKIVAFEGELPIDPSRRLRIVFTEAFPSMPPRVFDRASAKLLRRHHEPNSRQLCLFGVANARWNASCTSQNVLEEATGLIEQFGLGDGLSQDDVVPEPLSAMLPYAEGESILVPPPVSDFGNAGTQILRAELELAHVPRNRLFGSGRGVVISAKTGSQSLEADPKYPALLGQPAQKVTATAVYLPSVAHIGDLQSALSDCLKADIFGARKKLRWFAFVFPEQTGSTATRRNAWVFVRVDAQGRREWVRAYPYRTEERMARIASIRGIESSSAVFVGCGCLGSKIAVKLAASGVGQFALIDREEVDPYNSVRQEYGVDMFGLPKVEILSRRIQQFNPEADVGCLRFWIGVPNLIEEEQKLCEMLSRASVIVDTTGSHGVSRWITDISHHLGVPAIFTSVTSGAWGGEIVRSIPGRSACWRCWNAQYAESAPPTAPTTGFFAPGCNQPSFTGTTYDAEIVAGMASSLIVDTLLENESGQSSFKGDYIRWSGRDQNGPLLKAEILPVTARIDCPFCGMSG